MAHEKKEKMKKYILDFITNIEAYYVPYANKIVKNIIADYLSKYTEDELAELFELVTYNYSNSYKAPPDICQFEAAVEKKYKQSGLRDMGSYLVDMNDNVFDKKLVKIGHYDEGRFIPLLTEEKLRLKVIGMGAAKISPDMLIEFKSDN